MFIPFKSVLSDLLSCLHSLSYFKGCVGSKARRLQVLHKTQREPKGTLHRHGDRWEVVKFVEAMVAFIFLCFWKDYGYKFPQKQAECLIRVCITHTVSSGLCIRGIKRYLLVPLIIHRAKNCSTCTMRVSMGHKKMNKIRSQFQSLPQGHRFLHTFNSQKA